MSNPIPQSVLVISLSNIGDIILTFPVLDSLLAMYPNVKLDVVVGPKGEELLSNNPHINRLFIFNKKQKLSVTIRWLMSLRRQYYDLIIDLRNTAIPFALRGSKKTSPFLKRTKTHMRTQHWNRLLSLLPQAVESSQRLCMYVTDNDRQIVDEYLARLGLKEKPLVLVAPSAANRGKCWATERFAHLCDRLKYDYPGDVILIGDRSDQEIVRSVLAQTHQSVYDLSGRLSLPQLAYLMKRSWLLICNDTAPQHLASYLDIPVIVLFGPTDPGKYGPWGKSGRAIAKRDGCPACQKNDSAAGHDCLEAIEVDDVLKAFEWQPDRVILSAS